MAGSAAAQEADGRIDFDRRIRPILSQNCYHCHGPDAGTREAGLRLDQRDAALAELESGGLAIVPGDPESSELVRRIEADDEFELMPPPDSGKSLTAAEKQLLRDWIAQGAEYQEHWAFVPPVRPELPAVADESWIRNEVDRLVLAKLEREKLQRSPQAEPATLLRRLSFDLTGLSPTPQEVEHFLSNNSPDAYEEAVERLLASEHFGERMAMYWLDAARYSDTDGYQGDATRTNWPWRDWVIDAFNRNMPFDQFTLEQFAGDLLPDATPEQQLATSFHRNHMTNGEGGRDPEESRIDYVIDRVNTMGTVWLGLTLGCTQCHSHKYDPISQAEYYSLFAFFNSIDEDGRAGGGAKPFLEWQSKQAKPSIAQAEDWHRQQQAIEVEVRAQAEKRFPQWLDRQIHEVRNGYEAWRPLHAARLESEAGTRLTQSDDGIIQAGGPDPHHEDYRVIGPVPLDRITGLKLEILPHESHTGGGLSRSETGHFILSDVKLMVRSRSSTQIRDVKIAEAQADYSADPSKHGGYGSIKHVLDDDPRNGWASFGADLQEARTAVLALAEPLIPAEDEELVFELQQRALQGRHNIGRFRVLVTDQPGETPHSLGRSPLEDLAAANEAGPDHVEPKLRARLFEQFLADDPEFQAARAPVVQAKAQLEDFKRAAGKLKVMVLAERKQPRETHVLVRGVWDKKGEAVERGVPAAVAAWPDGAAYDRVELARWLTSRENPLTARVMVNHLWRLVFGDGLVRTPEDFGLQGEHPTHPELLDWLAVEFMDSGWDVKHMLRLMVSSAAYRQSSRASESLLDHDPENRLLARASRQRLPSWMIRDAALQASGLLNPTIGGPPVRPYQPAGVWADLTMGRFHYQPNVGPARYRRTVYTFWRRSAAPTFLFDSAQRRVCEVNTPRTNTPLHALTLMNDLTGLEAARALAHSALSEHSESEAQIDSIYRRVLSRSPDETETEVLMQQYDRALAYYRDHPEEAQRFLSHGQKLPQAEHAPVEWAALNLVASLVLNLDEAITRE